MKEGIIVDNNNIDGNEVSIMESDNPDTLMILFIASSFISFNALNNYYFQKLLSILTNGNYKVPHRSTLSGSILSNAYDMAIKEIISKSAKCEALSITCDGWSDQTCTHFWSITLHGIDDKMKLYSFVIALSPIYDDFSADSVGSILKGILDDIKIDQSKIKSIVTDGGGAAPNIHISMNLKPYTCSAHRLQNAIKSALELTIDEDNSLEGIIACCKEFVRRYKKSYKIRSYFEKTNPGFKTLKQSVITRWNSLFYCLQSLYPLRKDIVKYIKNKKNKLEFNFIILTNRDTWKLIHGLIELLKHFENITNKLSSENKPTINLVIKSILFLKSKIICTKVENVIVEKFKNNLLNSIDKYFLPFNSFEILSCFVDPSITHNGNNISSPFKEYIEKGIELIKDEIIKIYDFGKDKSTLHSNEDSYEDSFDAFDSQPHGVSNPENSDSANSFDIDDQYDNEEDQYKRINEEIDKYLRISSKKKYKLIEFWNKFKEKLPNIFTIAKDMLVIPATQTPSEREFSRAKLTKSDRRTRLNDQKLQKLTVLSALASQRNISGKRTKRSNDTHEIDDISGEEDTLSDDNLIEEESIEENITELSLSIPRSLPRNEFSFQLSRDSLRENLIIGLFSEKKYPNGYPRELNADILFGNKSRYITSLSPLSSNGITYGFTFELSQVGKSLFGARGSLIADLGTYVYTID